jgi:predicted permease
VSNPRNGPAAIGLRVYRALARAFPEDFKNEYGSDLARTAEDAVEQVWRREGMRGLLRMLADVALRVPIEHLAELRRDIRYGLRTLAGSPGFTLVAVASISLGIAVATCAYSEVNGLILRDLPGAPRPEELVALQAPVSFPGYKRYRESDLFVSMMAYVAPVPFGISMGGRTERIWGHLVTASYFPTLGISASMGRMLDTERDLAGVAADVVISHRLWEQHFGSDPSIVGKTLRVNGQACVVIGVGPRDFLGASPGYFPADLWMTVDAGARIAPELADNALERRDRAMFQVTGRLRPGISVDRAEAALDAVARQFERDYGEPGRERGGRRVQLVPGGKVLPIRRQDRPFFTEVLLILGGLLLLIACANVANMMLAKSASRRREIAVRLSLGATRGRLIRQLLTESMLIAAAAGAIAFIASAWLMRLASQIRMPYPVPVTFDLSPDLRVLLFTLAATGATGVAFGLIPAWQATRADLTPALKEGGNIQLRRHRRLNLLNGLMLCQMAGSLCLLLLTAFLGLGIQTTVGIQRGFDSSNLYLVSLDPVRDGYSGAQAAALFDKLMSRVRSLPSVTSATLTETVPVAMDGNTGATLYDARVETVKALRSARKHIVGQDYFETAGIPILRGRSFRKEDEKAGAEAVIVSQELVRAYWAGEEVLGRRIAIGNGEAAGGFGVVPGPFDFRTTNSGNGRQEFEVVGVAGDVSEDLIASKKHPAIYLPLRPPDYGQPSPRGVTLMVRGAPGADAMGAVQREIEATGAALTPFNARSMTEQIAEFMSALRSAAWTWNLLGAFGLILAATGLAGVTAYAVTQRGHEIGIRVALGARKRDVLGLVMKQGMIVVAAGTLIGMALTWAGVRLMSSFFFSVASVQSFEPAVLIGAPLLLAGLALAACYAPARRALRIDPAIALRRE